MPEQGEPRLVREPHASGAARAATLQQAEGKCTCAQNRHSGRSPRVRPFAGPRTGSAQSRNPSVFEAPRFPAFAEMTTKGVATRFFAAVEEFFRSLSR